MAEKQYNEAPSYDESVRSQKQSNTQETNLNGTSINYPPAPFGEVPITCICVSCQKRIVTRTEKVTGALTWVIAGVLCWFGCVPCCLIPFCVDSCKNTHHFCPNCSQLLGVHKVI